MSSKIHQSVCIFKDKSIGRLKINNGHHSWSQECPSPIRKNISETYLISYFLDIHRYVFYIKFYVFSKTNPMVGLILVKMVILHRSGRLQIILHQEHSRSIILSSYMEVLYIKLYVFSLIKPLVKMNRINTKIKKSKISLISKIQKINNLQNL